MTSFVTFLRRCRAELKRDAMVVPSFSPGDVSFSRISPIIKLIVVPEEAGAHVDGFTLPLWIADAAAIDSSPFAAEPIGAVVEPGLFDFLNLATLGRRPALDVRSIRLRLEPRNRKADQQENDDNRDNPHGGIIACRGWPRRLEKRRGIQCDRMCERWGGQPSCRSSWENNSSSDRLKPGSKCSHVSRPMLVEDDRFFDGGDCTTPRLTRGRGFALRGVAAARRLLPGARRWSWSRAGARSAARPVRSAGRR